MLDMLSNMTSIEKLSNAKDIVAKLGTHDAMILSDNGEVVCHADVNNQSSDPMTTLPSMQAVLKACKITGNFHLPEGYSLVSHKIPHPAAFITADWARIGRVRDKQNPSDPSLDKFKKNPQNIIYVENNFEEMMVTNPSQKNKIAHKSEDIVKVYIHKDAAHIQIERTSNHEVLKKSLKAFELWHNLISLNNKAKY